MFIVVPYGGHIIVLKRGLVMAVKFLGSKSEIHTKYSRMHIRIWRMVSVSCWFKANSIITYARLLNPFPRLKGFS